MESLDFSFVRLDKFIGLSRLADKKRQETKQTYYVDKQKINTTKINDDCITTERPAANTRLSDNSRIRAILEFHHPHYLHRGATVKAPAIRLLRLASVVMGQCKKQEDKVLRMKSLWRTVRYSTWKDFSLLADFWLRTAFSGGQFLADFRRKDFDFHVLDSDS